MTPLLLVGHGTRDEAGAGEFTRFAARMRGRLSAEVAGGFIELCPPPLADAVARLYDGGHRRLAAVPMVLVAAGHGKGDIPGALARERSRHPGLSFAYGRPLGPHPTLLRLLGERLDAVLDHAERPDTAVLLVGRGSTDPDANAELHKVARLLWEASGVRPAPSAARWTAPGTGDPPGRENGGLAMVEPAFVSLAAPGVPEGLERCRRLGARRVVVLPYFLFPGVLPARVLAQAKAYDGVEVRCADVLGDCDGLADLVLERYEEALAGDIRMNCDTCVYRSAIPGFEHRVGAAQVPHHHPDDHAH
jgi:sirohydrochlorin cobaltochelatase